MNNLSYKALSDLLLQTLPAKARPLVRMDRELSECYTFVRKLGYGSQAEVTLRKSKDEASQQGGKLVAVKSY